MGQSTPLTRHPVLVVEDEPVLRLDAIRILGERPDIRIVYMDLDMPRGVRGIEIAAAIRDRWPPIEIILTAAWLTAADLTLPVRAEFYPKPVVRDQIIDAMRRMAPGG